MPDIKEHCKECYLIFEKEYEEVHKWLNAFSDQQNHRKYRHHSEGIEEIRRMYGDEAAKAAKIHIIMDFGRIPTYQEFEDEMSHEN